MTLKLSAALAVLFFAATTNAATPTTGYLPQTSPAWLADIPLPSGVIKSWPQTGAVPSGPLPTTAAALDLTTGYPATFQIVTDAATDPQIVAVMKTIDWTKVPNVAPTTETTMTTYSPSDPYCWWTYNGCVTPKVDYIPPDISNCPKEGTWGLTYDDGPMYYFPVTPENEKWAEPNLYNYLLAHNDQKANLMYYGSRIVGAPDAAQRGLNDGHTICVHTWSHPYMTRLTNAQVVAEFYYGLKMIKQVLGITPRCWRPPYGDVDDRVRSIAWQMGLRNIMWDLDTNDWQIPGDLVPGGTLPYSQANATVAGWLENRAKGNDTKVGHVVLEHELSNSTITLAEFWLPTIQKEFQTMPATACNDIAQPYWEESFVYPIQGTVAISMNGSTTNVQAPQISGSTPSGTSSGSGAVSAPTGASKTGGAGHAAVSKITVFGLVAAAVAYIL
ncbi:hypothetical protein EMPS_07043 [Entomortierella parvispora]|uniref:NodB homology domain-containing protein n=1 Tax=Entomortierella parvispora TaxID=205924 RepID=A0A9P3HDE3_9FUNG|nr:hypothetical protein EMPS_07043 [Entomortierella parvispora]